MDKYSEQICGDLDGVPDFKQKPCDETKIAPDVALSPKAVTSH